MIEYAPEESEYNKSFLYTEVLISISNYVSTHFLHLKSNSSKKEDKYTIVQKNEKYKINYEVKIKDLKLGLTISDTIKYLDYALYDDVSEDFYDEDSEKEQHNMFKNFNKL